MYLRQVFFFSLLSCLVILSAAGQTDAGVDLDVDGPINAALASPDAQAALEQECIATLNAPGEWSAKYRVVKILAVVGSVNAVTPLAALLQNEESSHLARCALEPMPYPEVDAALMEALNTAPRKSQLGIISALASRKSRDAVPAIAALLGPDDKQMLDHVVMALARIGGDEAAGILEEMIKSGDSAAELAGAEALLALSIGLVEEGRGEDAAKQYYRLLETRWPDHIRAGAFAGLLKALPVQAPEAVLQAIQSEDALLRREGITSVARLDNAGVAAKFSAVLPSLQPEIQVSLLESLARREEPMEPSFLYGLLADERDEMRIAAMKAIAIYGDAGAIAPLAGQFTPDSSREVNQAAIETLRRLKGEAVEAELIAYMTAAPMEQRSGLIEALVQRNAVSAIDALLEQTSQEMVRPAAFKALGILAGPDRLDAVLAALVAMAGDSGRNEAENAMADMIQNAGLSASSLVITKATYGDLPDGAFSDVTAKVREKITEGTLSFPVSNALFGDPAPGKPKSLSIEYTRSDVAESKNVPEGGVVDVASGSIPDEIIAKITAPLNGAASTEACASIFRILSRVGGQKAYEVVKGYVNHESAEIRDAAVRAITSWPDPFVAPDVAALYASIADGTHRSLALRGSVRLLRTSAMPKEQITALYGALMDAANSADERKLILSGVAELDSPEAVRMVYPLLSDESVKEEATLALEKIRGKLGEEAYANTIALLNPDDAGSANAQIVDETFVPIFNGENLDGWSGDPSLWRVEDGAIVAESKADKTLEHNTFLVWEGDKPADFDIKFRYKLESEWVNSGLQFRSERFENNRVRGYQADISREDWITGICYEEGGRGILARRGQSLVIGADGKMTTTVFADENALKDYIYPDDWNEYEVHVRGNKFYVRINGHKMHEVTDDSPEARRSGVIAFQLHAGPPMKIRIKDVMIKRVAPEDQAQR